jgi:hypothetical protein
MEIGGWRTRSVFERYNIKNQADSVDVLQRLERNKARRLEQIELGRRHEEQNPTFEFGTNTVPIGLGVGGIGKSGKVN